MALSKKFTPKEIYRFEELIKKQSESPVLFTSPAKINFSLKIGKKESNGMHKIFSFMRTIKLHDDIEFYFNAAKNKGSDYGVINLSFKPGSFLKNSKKGFDSKTVPCYNNTENTAVKAAKIFMKNIGVENYFLNINVNKNIPMEAGLGGGSSNAASMLIELNRKFEFPFNIEELRDMSKEIGSDVPFFFTKGNAVVSGFGDEIVEINDQHLIDYYVVLLIPNFGISTKAAYSDYDDFLLTNNQNYYNIQYLDFEKLTYENDFEAVIFKQYPILGEMKKSLLREGAEIAMLSGSGSTVYGAFRMLRLAESYISKLQSFSFIDNLALKYLTTTV